ncbi:MAG: VWA domain-containing protein [Clostridium sp.]|nr:VWA domain-containing protein [Clostridium sp.]
MFINFLYYLRGRGLKVSTTEWVALEEALETGLANASLTGFYHLCRAILVKDESEFDLFDDCFLEYFRDSDSEPEIPEELKKWLNRPELQQAPFDEQQAEINSLLDSREIEDMFRKRQDEQKSAHNKGSYWIGTHGMSVFGNAGMSPDGIRVEGDSSGRRAFRVAGERRFRDFRKDNTLDTRQFQVALRRLRQFSGLIDLPATEFDVDNTIHDTADNGGTLSVRYKRPRKNTIKLLLLMDSGGSMDYYSTLCSALFQAVTKTRHFKDLKIYYFHNCIYSRLYTDPTIGPTSMVPTDRVMTIVPGDYKLIIVGDATMAPEELFESYSYKTVDGQVIHNSGHDWLQIVKDRYHDAIWLNPGARPEWNAEWAITYDAIAKIFPMFPLSVEGIEAGMKELL